MSICVFDTDVVIAALDRSDLHHQDASKLIGVQIESDTERLISTINYAEALVRPARDPATMRTAVEAIATLGILPVPPSPEVARHAAVIRGHKISLADGFALATAIEREAVLASFDQRVRRAAKQLRVGLAA